MAAQMFADAGPRAHDQIRHHRRSSSRGSRRRTTGTPRTIHMLSSRRFTRWRRSWPLR
jgi:hypothetical protein